ETGEPVSLLQKQRLEESGGANLAGTEVDGYDRFNVSQAQMTLIKFFDQVMGASRMSFISEIGATYIHDLPGLDEERYGRFGTFGIGEHPGGACDGTGTGGQPAINLNTSSCTNDGFVTDFS